MELNFWQYNYGIINIQFYLADNLELCYRII